MPTHSIKAAMLIVFGIGLRDTFLRGLCIPQAYTEDKPGYFQTQRKQDGMAGNIADRYLTGYPLRTPATGRPRYR